MRRLAGVLMAVALSGTLAGCSKQASDDEKRLLAAVTASERLAHRLLYKEVFLDGDGSETSEVRGLVEDDFRYKVRVAKDGRPVLDEVVSDDALVVRLLDPLRLEEFVRPPAKDRAGGEGVTGAGGANAGEEAPPASPAGEDSDRPDPVEALRTRRWVLDPGGAPGVFGRGDDAELGQDTILDALDTFDYVRRAIGEATRVVVYDSESIEPVYRPKEDPFKKPEKGVLRYDFDPPNLPRPADRAGGNQITPDIRHFRKMAVYVRDGRMIRVDEVVDVASRLDDIAKLYETEFPEDVTTADLAVIAVDALNTIRVGQGQDVIRLRTMSFALTDLGDAIKVDVPTDVVETSLAVLQNRGLPSEAATGAALAETVRAGSLVPRDPIPPDAVGAGGFTTGTPVDPAAPAGPASTPPAPAPPPG